MVDFLLKQHKSKLFFCNNFKDYFSRINTWNLPIWHKNEQLNKRIFINRRRKKEKIKKRRGNLNFII